MSLQFLKQAFDAFFVLFQENLFIAVPVLLLVFVLGGVAVFRVISNA